MKSFWPCSLVLGMLGLTGWLSAYGQPKPDSDLKQLVDAMRRARTLNFTPPSAGAAHNPQGHASPPVVPIVLWDGKSITEEALNAHTLAEVNEVALRFDPAYSALYGVAGGRGVIIVTSKKANH